MPVVVTFDGVQILAFVLLIWMLWHPNETWQWVLRPMLWLVVIPFRVMHRYRYRCRWRTE